VQSKDIISLIKIYHTFFTFQTPIFNKPYKRVYLQ